MEHEEIVGLVEFLVWGILGIAAFIVILKAATGQINLRGVLRSSAESGISAARVQLLLMSLIAAFGYLDLVVTTLANPKADLTSLPPVPDAILGLVGGSHGFYLGAKGLITGGWLDRLRGS